MLRLALDVPVMLRRRYPGRRRRRSGSARSHGSSSWRSRSTSFVQNSASGRSEVDQESSEGPALGADNAQQRVVDERVDGPSGSSKAPAAPTKIVSVAEALSKSGRRGSNPRPSAWEADALPLSYSRDATREGVLRAAPRGQSVSRRVLAQR